MSKCWLKTLGKVSMTYLQAHANVTDQRKDIIWAEIKP
jgi:hypothetical protein